MNTVLWILQILLAVIFLSTGLLKSTRSIDAMAPITGNWVHEFPEPVVRGIAVAELAAAVGLIVPAATGIAPWLTPLAATGLVIIMLGAILTHLRTHDWAKIGLNLVLLALAAVVAWGRFGPYAL